MIEFDHVSLTYVEGARPVLLDVDLVVPDGEFALVAGRTGSGKSTLLRSVNGLVPRFTGGHLEGSVRVDGVSTAQAAPRDLAHLVGVVGQDPMAGFVTDTVEEELAYGMEQLAVPAPIMRKRVEEVLDLLGIADLRHRALRTLSGGQQQRVAIGSVLSTGPRILVLDEPTSALDPTAAEDVLATLARLVHDLGVTVLVAEHRLERVLQFADRLVLVEPDGTGSSRVRSGDPQTLVADLPIRPPVVQLGEVLGWDPLPLTVRDARRCRAARPPVLGPPPAGPGAGSTEVLLSGSEVTVRYGQTVAVRSVDVQVHQGEVVVLMGRNGSGKSTLLWALQGSLQRHAGRVRALGQDPVTLTPEKARAIVGLVPQTASDLLYLETVEDECAAADRESGAQAGTCRDLLDRLAPGIQDQTHPRDLSEGQKLCLVLAIQLTAAPAVVLLDEPTRGLDYEAKETLVSIVTGLTQDGVGVLISTHDVEFAARIGQRVVVMAQGEVVAEGATPDVIASSPLFAPQVAKVLGPPWLTVPQVAHALGRTS